MLEQLDFEILRMRHLRAIMNLQAAFRPDGRTPLELEEFCTEAGLDRTAYIGAQTDRDLARGAVTQAAAALHDACIAVHAILKSRYRLDKVTMRRVLRLPVSDETAADSEKRGQAISALWLKLPMPPRATEAEVSLGQFIAFPGMTPAAFEGLLTVLRARQGEQPAKEQAMEGAEAVIHERKAALAEVNTAMLVQGRAQFPTGVVAEMLDAVPSELSTQAPEQPVISEATATGPGAVRLVYDAPGGSLFDVLDDPPGPVEEVLLLDDTPLKTVDLTGLAPGVHAFTVIAINSRGESVPSEPASVTVG